MGVPDQKKSWPVPLTCVVVTYLIMLTINQAMEIIKAS